MTHTYALQLRQGVNIAVAVAFAVAATDAAQHAGVIDTL